MPEEEKLSLFMRETELREQLHDVRQVVLELNSQQQQLAEKITRSKLLQKEIAIERQGLTEAIRNRWRRLGHDHPKLSDGAGIAQLEKQLVALDHARASTLADMEKLTEKGRQIDRVQLPYVEEQRRLINEIQKLVAKQHDLKTNINNPYACEENLTMHIPGSTEFNRVSQKSNTQETKKGKKQSTPPNIKRIEELQKQLDSPKPKVQMNPPGMPKNIASRIKKNKEVGDEMVRIQKAINARRGQARNAFKRSGGG